MCRRRPVDVEAAHGWDSCGLLAGPLMRRLHGNGPAGRMADVYASSRPHDGIVACPAPSPGRRCRGEQAYHPPPVRGRWRVGAGGVPRNRAASKADVRAYVTRQGANVSL